MSDGIYPVGVTVEGQRKITEERRLRALPPDVQRPPRRGKITRVISPVGAEGEKFIYVYIRFYDTISETSQETSTRPFRLSHTAEELAMVYGEDLVGYEVKVDFMGPDPNQGVATIVNMPSRGDLEAANTLRAFGTLLAPAGNGMI